MKKKYKKNKHTNKKNNKMAWFFNTNNQNNNNNNNNNIVFGNNNNNNIVFGNNNVINNSVYHSSDSSDESDDMPISQGTRAPERNFFETDEYMSLPQNSSDNSIKMENNEESCIFERKKKHPYLEKPKKKFQLNEVEISKKIGNINLMPEKEKMSSGKEEKMEGVEKPKEIQREKFNVYSLNIKGCVLDIGEDGRIGTDLDFKKIVQKDNCLEIVGDDSQIGMTVFKSNHVVMSGNSFNNMVFGSGNSIFGPSSSIYMNGKKMKLVPEDDNEKKPEEKKVATVEYYLSPQSLIQQITMSSAGSFKIHKKFVNFQNLSVTVAGSGEVDLPRCQDYGTLTLSVAGSGDINLENSNIKNLTLTLAGSGDVDLAGCKAQVGTLILNGSGDIQGLTFVQSGNIMLSGSGDIKVYKQSKTTTINKTINGSGSIKIR